MKGRCPRWCDVIALSGRAVCPSFRPKSAVVLSDALFLSGHPVWAFLAVSLTCALKARGVRRRDGFALCLKSAMCSRDSLLLALLPCPGINLKRCCIISISRHCLYLLHVHALLYPSYNRRVPHFPQAHALQPIASAPMPHQSG